MAPNILSAAVSAAFAWYTAAVRTSPPCGGPKRSRTTMCCGMPDTASLVPTPLSPPRLRAHLIGRCSWVDSTEGQRDGHIYVITHTCNHAYMHTYIKYRHPPHVNLCACMQVAIDGDPASARYQESVCCPELQLYSSCLLFFHPAATSAVAGRFSQRATLSQA